VRCLQEDLKPLLLRRMKEDVEALPEKEEVVIWVELTAQQRAYYKAIYGRQIGTLLSGGQRKNLPGLRNLAMELRKARTLCNCSVWPCANDAICHRTEHRHLGNGSGATRSACGGMQPLELPSIHSTPSHWKSCASAGLHIDARFFEGS